MKESTTVDAPGRNKAYYVLPGKESTTVDAPGRNKAYYVLPGKKSTTARTRPKPRDTRPLLQRLASLR